MIWIWQDKKRGGNLYKSLRHNGKLYQKRGAAKAGRGCIPDRTDISERPKIVEDKTRFGDIEADLIMGQQGGGALVSLVDRATKFCWLQKLDRKTAYQAADSIINTLLAFRKTIHTITFDNGKEFAHHVRIREVLGAQTYFCRPYQSWERGLNEHTNGLVREH
jgi:transposase, IS30 family